jgi:hypothetical protein
MEYSSKSADRQQRTYVLRLWREHGSAPWRAALRSAESGSMLGFADLDELIAFLEHEMEPGQPSANLAPQQPAEESR